MEDPLILVARCDSRVSKAPGSKSCHAVDAKPSCNSPSIQASPSIEPTMHILMLSDVFFPRINGVSTSIATFGASLQTLGMSISLIAPRYPETGKPPVHSAHEGLTLHRIASRRVPFDPEDRLMSMRQTRQAVLDVHAEKPIDLIHVHTPFVAQMAGVAAARVLQVPVVATYHTLFEEYFHHYLPLAPRWLTRSFARTVSRLQCNQLDAVIVPSRAMRDRLQDYGVRVPAHVVPTGIPLERFAALQRADFRARHGIPPERPVALFVGRVAHEKNIGFLIEALAAALPQCPELLLLIAGEGPARTALEAIVHERGLDASVRFVGYLERQAELPACYAAADAFVFASRTETQGLVLIEAMAMGLPVVALSVMGTRDLLDGDRGCIVPDDDPKDFGNRLAGLLADPARRSHLAGQAREVAQEWSDMAMTMRLRTLYRNLRDRY